MKPQKPKKPKKCKGCKEEFLPKQNLQSYCSAKCAPKPKRAKIKKKTCFDLVKEKTALNSNDLVNLLRMVFNAYIRERDKGKSCISCSTILTENYDAGHYYPVSAHGNLRFNEDNVHGQCKSCNQFKDGNINAYKIGLINRIGTQGMQRLELAKQNNDKLYSVEIQPLIAYYKKETENIKEIRLNIG